MTETLDEAVQRLLDSRVEQGFERTCSDPSVYAELAAMVRETTPARWKGRTRRARRIARVAKGAA